MKWPTVRRMQEQRCLHIETEDCIVNIKFDLTDLKGRKVTVVEIIPDNFVGEPKRKLIGYSINRIIRLKTIKR